jgi:anion-transporting  ArsA/GET3 family ATPase
MGLTELDNTPRPVHDIDTTAGGTLDAMMLDMKRTFDEVVVAHSTPEKADQILANPFYQAVSSSFAGTQEYMAMEKLGQLHQEVRANGDDEGGPRWDLIVVDTPPSRSALDFLDAPKRLGSFLDGRFIRLISAPAKAGGRAGLRVFNVGIGLVSSTLSRVLGGEMLRDVQTFVGALDTMFGGFRQRADQTYALLAQRSTAFLVVAAPERDALREASYFIARLETERMPLTGLVLNRVQQVQAPGLGAARARAAAEDRTDDGDHLSAGLLALHADIAGAADRQRKLARRFSVGHPSTPVVEVPALAEDVHDVDGLRQVGEALAAG